MSDQYVLRNADVVMPYDGIRQLDIVVKNGLFSQLLERGQAVDIAEEIDANGLLLFPGVIDPHIHQNITTSDNSWRTETRSALVGGVTTIIDFQMSDGRFLDELDDAIHRSENASYVDFAYQCIMTRDEHLEETNRIASQYGAPTFKMFMNYKGDEGANLGAKGTDDGYLFQLMQQIASIPNGRLSVHAENIEVVWYLREQLMASGRQDLRAYEESRPGFVEAEDIHKAIHYSSVTGCPLHIVHLTSSEGVQAVINAKNEYPDAVVTVETCPQYLTQTVASSAGVLARINPPVRYQKDCDALWDAIASGLINTIGSDHCSRDKATKLGDSGGINVWKTQNAFPGMATLFPLLLSEGYHKRGLSLTKISELTSANAAKIYGLWPRKGNIQVGFDADFTLVDINKVNEITPELLQSHCDWTVWDGWKTKGWPVATYIRGTQMMKDGRVVGPQGFGKYLMR